MLFIGVCVMCFAAHSKSVSVDDARRVAANFWSQTAKSECPILVNISPILGLTEQYLFVSSNNDGFVIVAADDIATPILGYSVTNGFTGESLPEHLDEWLRHYDHEIAAARDAGYRGDKSSDDEWERLLNNRERKGPARKSVAPMVATQWDQGHPYNMKCPYDHNGSSNVRSVTGCVATAMSQVLKYWNWPLKGSGSHSYTCYTISESAPTRTVEADFSSTTYNWSLMPAGGGNTAGSWTSGQKNAVSTLIFHCGVSVEMKYTYSSSSSSSSYIPNALKSYFGYATTVNYVHKQGYTEDNWKNLIKGEIDAGRPVLYRGEGEDGTGGHSFVCDGYDASDNFHFNWGWSGAGDGYYSTNSLTPTSTGTGAGLGDYTYSQGVVIKITPQFQTYNTFSVTEYVGVGGELVGSVGLRNSGMTSFSGYIGVAVYNSEDLLITLLATSDQITFNGNSTRTITINHTLESSLTPGTYTAKAVCSLDGATWYPVKSGYNGCATEAQFTVTDGSEPLVENNLKTFENFSINRSNYSVGDAIIGSCGIKNIGTGAYSGLIGVAAYNQNGDIAAIMATASRSIAVNSATTLQFNYTIPAGFAVGTYSVKAISSTDNGNTWKVIRGSSDGTPTELNFSVGNNSIRESNLNNISIGTSGRNIVVNSAAGLDLTIIDMMGRVVHKARCKDDSVTLSLEKRGIYLVKIGNMPAKKIFIGE